MKIIKFLLIYIVLFCSCLSSQNDNKQLNNDFHQYVKKYDSIEIDSIILNNDTTVIVAWTEWCKGSHDGLKYLKQFNNGKSDNIGIICVYCGDKFKLTNILEEFDYKYPVYLLSASSGGVDKVKFNRLFHKLFNNYKSVNYVPIQILCNSQKQILNLNTIIHIKHYDIDNDKVAYYPVFELIRK